MIGGDVRWPLGFLTLRVYQVTAVKKEHLGWYWAIAGRSSGPYPTRDKACYHAAEQAHELLTEALKAASELAKRAKIKQKNGPP